MQNKKTLSRGFNYLGELGAKLRELQGTSTLAHELIQNAEDAIKDIPLRTKAQSTLVFRIDEHALTIDNGGTFSDCHRQDLPSEDCPWKATNYRPCDFHSFRDIGGAAKRQANSAANQGLKGAFGFGFTAVYQVTDHPHLLSSGRHWVLEDDKREDERISECADEECEYCKCKPEDGTRFILPWAFDEQSTVRRGLRAAAVTKDQVHQIGRELIATLPKACLFLDHLTTIEVFVNGKKELCVSVSDRAQRYLQIDCNSAVTKWLILTYDFADDAAKLLAKHPHGEKKPTSIVKVAIPECPDENGSFFAFLPTQVSTGVPYHVHADFFPSNDRKRLLLENDHQGDWNRAAIKAAYQAFAIGLDEVRTFLGPEKFWDLIKCIKYQRTGSPDIDGHLWSAIVPHLKTKQVVPTSIGNWRKPSEVILPTVAERDWTGLHDQLSIETVSKLVSHHSELLRSNDVGVEGITIEKLVAKLREKGFVGVKALSELPIWFHEPNNLDTLWMQVAECRRKEKPIDPKTALKHPLRSCSLVLCTDGKLREPQQCLRADDGAQKLFTRLDPHIAFAGPNEKMHVALDGLLADLGTTAAVNTIGNYLSQNVQTGPSQIDLFSILMWLDLNAFRFQNDTAAISRIRAFPICMTVDGLRAFSGTVRPGGFKDPIGVTSVVDGQFLQAHLQLVELVGLQTLTLEEYICKYLPKAFQNRTIHNNQCAALVDMLATHFSSLYDDSNIKKIKETLQSLAMLECEDGKLRCVKDKVYAPEQSIRQVMSSDANYVAPRMLKPFLQAIGVRTVPELPHVVERVASVSHRFPTPTNEARQQVELLVSYLAKHIEALENNKPLLDRLAQTKWIPGDRKHWSAVKAEWRFRDEVLWYKPTDVQITNLKCTESAAIFSRLQSKSAALTPLSKIGLQFASTSLELVFHHIENCSKYQAPLDEDVYRYLSRCAENGVTVSQLERLRTLCLFYDDIRQCWVRSQSCYVEEHSLGRFGTRLSPEVARQYPELLKALAIKPKPTWEDAIEVLQKLAQLDEQDSNDTTLDEDKKVAHFCWRLINTAIEDSTLEKSVKERLGRLGDLRVVCKKDGRLARPKEVLLRDRESLAKLLDATLGQAIIPFAPKMTTALQAVGVRRVSEVSTMAVIVDRLTVLPSFEVEQRLRERKGLLESIIQTQKLVRRRVAEIPFDELVVFSCPRLEVEVTVHGLEEQFTQQQQQHSVQAVFELNSKSLFYSLDGGEIPWDSLACELAKACFNSEDVAQLASAFNAALEPKTLIRATKKLHSLGFPEIEWQVEEAVEVTRAHMPHPPQPLIETTSGHAEIIPAPQHVVHFNSSDSFSDSAQAATVVVNPEVPIPPEPLSAAMLVPHADSDSISMPQSPTYGSTTRLPDFLASQSGGSDRRSMKIRESSAQLPRRAIQDVTRQVRQSSISKAEILPYLKDMYGEKEDLFCQMKSEQDEFHHRMPYRNPSKEFAWVKSELFNRELASRLPRPLPEDHRLHLLLCPTCAAIFRDFIANQQLEQIRFYHWIINSTSETVFSLNCTLGGIQPNRSVHFHPKHLDDIRAVDGIGEWTD